MSRAGGLAAVVIGGAALAGYAAMRALGQERAATVVPLMRLSRRVKSRAGLVPAALGAQGRATRLARACSRLRRQPTTAGSLAPACRSPHCPSSFTWPPSPTAPRPAGAPQGRLSVEPGEYPAVRRDESVVETLHGEEVADPYRWVRPHGGGQRCSERSRLPGLLI